MTLYYAGLSKLINYLAHRNEIGNSWEQNRGYFLDRFPMRFANHMPVDSEGYPRVRVPELLLRHLWRCSAGQQEAGV